MPTDSRTVVIVGGGIAGLSAAYGLAENAASHDSPPQCTLIEAAPRLGGKILTERVGSFVIEGGPDSFLSQKPWGIELCRQLGLADRVIGTNQDRRQTYVYVKGRLEELPEGLALGVPTRLGPFLRSGVLSWKGKLRLGAELLIPRRRERGVGAVRVSGVPRGYEVVIEGTAPLVVDALILATPAYDAATLLEPLDDELSALLRGIPYTSTATISLGFHRRDFSHRLDGYGFVVPRIEGRALLAVTWTSSKWSHRAPDDAVLLRAYVGGAGREAVLEQSDDGLVSLVRAELRAMMGITEVPVLARVYRWPRAMPQYLVGHLERLAAIDERLARWPGLFLTGAGYRGVGIPDCIHDALDTAERVRVYFDKGASRAVE